MRPSEQSELTLVLVLAAVVAVIAATAGLWQLKQNRDATARAIALTGGGDPVRGRELMARYGCGGCHHIPGVPNAEGRVGPSLRQFAGRTYIGGTVLNTPDNLMRWIQDAPSLAPRTAMPRTGASADEARDIATFLYTRG